MINPQQLFNFSADQITRSDEEITLVWKVPEDLPYFEGHFPGNPILPGVAVLDLIQVLLNGGFKSIKSAKFTEVIRPLDTLTIKARFDASSGFWNINVSNQNGVNVCKTVLQIT